MPNIAPKKVLEASASQATGIGMLLRVNSQHSTARMAASIERLQAAEALALARRNMGPDGLG